MDKNKGFRIRSMNILMIVTIAVVCGLVMFTNISMRKKYDKLEDLQNNYVNCVHSSQMLQSSSNFLTEQTIRFAETKDISSMKLYFEEVDSKRRENAINNVIGNVDEKDRLIRAKMYSDELMQIEFHIMKLVVEGANIDLREVPEDILNYQLTLEEIGLSKEEMIEKARDMVFGQEYREYRDKIDKEIDIFFQGTLENIKMELSINNKDLESSIMIQQILMILIVIVIFVEAWVIYSQIVVTIHKFTENIRDDVPLESHGVYELRYLANTYNDMLDKRDTQEKELKIQAETDGLTGLLNRRSFDDLLNKCLYECKETERQVALLLIDVDCFKTINDTYGHTVGDKALIRLSQILREKFRATDYVARLGGDEFAIIAITNDNPNRSKRLSNIIDEINEKLCIASPDVPCFSISAGLAFSTDQDIFEDLYKRTDNALYASKSNGGRRCSVNI